MAEFKDNQGRVWKVSVTVATLKRVKELTGVNLGTDLAESVKSVTGDPILLCDVLYAVCKPQCDEKGVSDVSFGESLGGDSIGAATDAFLEGITDFLSDPVRRAHMKSALAKMRAATEAAIDKAAKELESITPEQVLAEISGG